MKEKGVVLRKQWVKCSKGRCRSKRRWAPCIPKRPVVTLRPVNVNGNRARGMSAPKNTNQFLMTEKYEMQAMRSDSVDSGSESSDMELTDMDSYLGAWENARGALLDSPSRVDQCPGRWEEAPRVVMETSPVQKARTGVHFLDPNEDSVQYFPSEDDLILSDNFMHRDFAEFCDKVTA